jgi:hypothetical protein
MYSDLQYLERHQIDTIQWDRCIAGATNGLIYGYSWYLDHMAHNWDALVWNNYQAVMPLPFKKKWGIRYVTTPPFVQRLAVFGNEVPAQVIQAFYQEAGRRFSYIDLMTAEAMDEKNWQSTVRQNLVIDLSPGYEAISAGYTDECKSNIRKSVQRGCRFTTSIDIEQVIRLYRDMYGQYYSGDAYQRLSQLAQAALLKKCLIIAGVAGQTGKIIQGALLFNIDQRIYYMLAAPTADGRKARATYYFIDQVIRRYAGQPLLFDFEGSDIPDVAAFYNRFGPARELYYHHICNQLPWPLRWLK